MTMLRPAAEALRAHDVHQGLHDLDRNSGLILSELKVTQLIGMAAALASWIKGQEIIADAHALEVVAAEQLDVNQFAFDRVVGLLEELDYVRNVKRVGGRIVTFYESVPASYERMYEQLGESWRSASPTETESALVGVVDQLSRGPASVDDIDVEPDVRERALAVGTEAEAIQIVQVGGRDVAYSPFFAYEKPEALGAVLKDLDIARVTAAFGVVRELQGVPVSVSVQGDILTGLMGAGLMAGPSLERPDRTIEQFAVAPYGLPADILTIRRPVLEKALAILAAVRMGEYFGGMTNLASPVALLSALKQTDRVVAWHSSTVRQYGALQRLGIVRFVRFAGRSGISLIDHEDNRTAVDLAIDLLTEGEATATKEVSTKFERALLVPGNYRSQIQGIRPARERRRMPNDELSAMVEAVMGRRAE